MLSKVRSMLINQLVKKGIGVNCINLEGFNKDTNTIKSITVSLEDITSCDNILYEVKRAIDEVEYKYNITIGTRLVDI